jgi:hypothetical protein
MSVTPASVREPITAEQNRVKELEREATDQLARGSSQSLEPLYPDDLAMEVPLRIKRRERPGAFCAQKGEPTSFGSLTQPPLGLPE